MSGSQTLRELTRSGQSDNVSEEARALLQRRVAIFALVMGGLNLVGLIVRSVALHQYQELYLPFLPQGTIALHGVATGSLLATWLYCRGKARRSFRSVRIAEHLGLLGAGAGFALMAHVITHSLVTDELRGAVEREPSLAVPTLIAMLFPVMGTSFGLAAALVLRAAFVPTGAWQTVRLTGVVAIPIVLVDYDAGQMAEFLNLPHTALWFGISGFVEWCFVAMVCGLISRVVYGLHEEVQKAQRLGQYTLEARIGAGGMGIVYRASHAMLRRPTAIKLLAPDKMGEQNLKRFEREVRLTARLTHPNTITIYDYGRTEEGLLYYAMELLDGASLDQIVEVGGAQPAERVAHILYQVAGSLKEAHGEGLIHRDIKPGNVMLCHQGGDADVAKVVDFGLVKDLDQDEDAALSREGSVSGTPLYMAPEAIVDAKSGPQSDLYALGAVGYFLITGEHVFSGHNMIEVLGHHLHSEPEAPSLRLGDPIPEALESLILDCLRKDPAARPQGAVEIRRRLEQGGCLGKWGQERAERWWQLYGASLRAKISLPTDATRTLAIDILDRHAASTIDQRKK